MFVSKTLLTEQMYIQIHTHLHTHTHARACRPDIHIRETIRKFFKGSSVYALYVNIKTTPQSGASLFRRFIEFHEYIMVKAWIQHLLPYISQGFYHDTSSRSALLLFLSSLTSNNLYQISCTSWKGLNIFLSTAWEGWWKCFSYLPTPCLELSKEERKKKSMSIFGSLSHKADVLPLPSSTKSIWGKTEIQELITTQILGEYNLQYSPRSMFVLITTWSSCVWIQ